MPASFHRKRRKRDLLTFYYYHQFSYSVWLIVLLLVIEVRCWRHTWPCGQWKVRKNCRADWRAPPWKSWTVKVIFYFIFLLFWLRKLPSRLWNWYLHRKRELTTNQVSHVLPICLLYIYFFCCIFPNFKNVFNKCWMFDFTVYIKLLIIKWNIKTHCRSHS